MEAAGKDKSGPGPASYNTEGMTAKGKEKIYYHKILLGAKSYKKYAYVRIYSGYATKKLTTVGTSFCLENRIHIFLSLTVELYREKKIY